MQVYLERSILKRVILKRVIFKHTLLIASLLAAGLAQAAAGPEFSPQKLSQDVKVLASDEFEGRGPNTAGETKTVNYLIEQFKACLLYTSPSPRDS